MKYGDTYISVRPGAVIEKTFYLDLYAIEKPGTAFQKPGIDGTRDVQYSESH